MNAINSTWPLASSLAHAQPSSPDFALLESLQCRSALELDADRTAPGVARKWLAAMLEKWSLTQFEESATLIASELLTNSIVEVGKVAWAEARPPVRLRLYGGPALIALLVGDAIAAAPVPREAADDEESGRGLFLVGQYSSAWGFYYEDELDGKVTWALIGTL